MTNPYATPEYARLIAAIAAAPDDDLPRLVAADWLEEKGQAERAEFVRIQCEIAQLERESGGRLPVKVVPELGLTTDMIAGPSKLKLSCEPGEPDYDRWRALKAREGELWESNCREWEGLRPVNYEMNSPAGSCPYSRGFLHSLRIRGEDWITHNAAILRLNPIRKVVVIWDQIGEWTHADTAKWWPNIEFTFERTEPIVTGNLTFDIRRIAEQMRQEPTEADLETARRFVEAVNSVMMQLSTSLQPAVASAAEAFRAFGEAVAPITPFASAEARIRAEAQRRTQPIRDAVTRRESFTVTTPYD